MTVVEIQHHILEEIREWKEAGLGVGVLNRFVRVGLGFVGVGVGCSICIDVLSRKKLYTHNVDYPGSSEKLRYVSFLDGTKKIEVG